LPFQGIDAAWKCADIFGRFVLTTHIFMAVGITLRGEVLTATFSTWDALVSLAMLFL
jgi:hypothetical protein